MRWQARIRCVLFDLGGTLFAHLPRKVTQHNLQRVLQPVLQAGLTGTQCSRYHQLRAETEGEFVGQKFFLHRTLVTTSFVRFAKELALPERALPDLADAFYRAQRDSVTRQLQLRNDALAVIAQLQALGLQVGIVSNIDDEYLNPLLDRTAELRSLSFVLSSESARSCKPDPDIYLQALVLASEPAERVLFVGDSFRNDVAGPAEVGMRTCWFTADQVSSPTQALRPDLVITELSELPPRLTQSK